MNQTKYKTQQEKSISFKNTKNSEVLSMKNSKKDLSENDKGKLNKYISVSLFNNKNLKRSSSLSLSSSISKFTSQLKSSINPGRHQTKSNSNTLNKMNCRSTSEISSLYTSSMTTPKSVPTFIPSNSVKDNSAKTDDVTKTGNIATVKDNTSVSSSATPIINKVHPIYMASNGRWSCSSPILSNFTPKSTHQLNNSPSQYNDLLDIQNYNQNCEFSPVTLSGRKDNNNILFRNIPLMDSCSVGFTNSNSATLCTNTSCDKLTDSKEIPLAQNLENNNSNETLNKENMTFSMFSPKTVLGKESLQHSMQKEINGIMERFDQKSINDISSSADDSVVTHTSDNDQILTDVNNDLNKSKNEAMIKDLSFTKETKDEAIMKDLSFTKEIKNEAIIKDLSFTKEEDVNKSEITLQDDTVADLDNSTLESQKNYINDVDLVFLDLSKIKADLSDSSLVESNKIIPESPIIVAPVTIASYDNIPHVTNQNLPAKSENDKMNSNAKLKSILDLPVPNKISEQHTERTEKTVITSSTPLHNNDKVSTNININNNKNNGYSDSYLNEKINRLSLTRILNGDSKPEIIDNDSTNIKKKSNYSLIRAESNNKNEVEKENKELNNDINTIEPFPLNLTPEARLQLFKNDSRENELLSSFKTALLFLSENEANSNNRRNSEFAISSKKKSSNTLNSLYKSNSRNKKYKSLPSLFTSSSNSNMIMPLNDNDENKGGKTNKLMYPVNRLDSGRKLRAYYGVNCPIVLGNGSKTKISNYYGVQMYDDENDKSNRNSKNQRFGIKRLTSFLRLKNNDLNSPDTNKNQTKMDKKDDIKKKESECEVEYVPEPKIEKEDSLYLYDKQGEIIQHDNIENPSTNQRISIPMKNATAIKEYYNSEVKNVSNLIKMYDKDSEIYSSKEFSFKDSFSMTLPFVQKTSVKTKDENKASTFHMIPSHLKKFITNSSVQRSFYDTEPYLSSFSFEHQVSEYSSSESSFEVSNKTVSVNHIRKTSTTINPPINDSSFIDNDTNQTPLGLNNSFVIQKTPGADEEINEDDLSFTIDGIPNPISNHSTNGEIDSLFLYQLNINDLPEVDVSKQESKREEQKETQPTLFKDLYNKSFITRKSQNSSMSYSTSEFSFNTFDRAENLISNCSFLLEEEEEGREATGDKNVNQVQKNDNNNEEEDYNFYEPPIDMDYSDNYLVAPKKKSKLRKPSRAKSLVDELMMMNTMVTPVPPNTIKCKASSFNASTTDRTDMNFTNDSFDQSENPISNCSFILEEEEEATDDKNTNQPSKDNSDNEEAEDYDFYEPPEGMDYGDNYLVTPKVKLAKPGRTKDLTDDLMMVKNMVIPVPPIAIKCRTSSLNTKFNRTDIKSNHPILNSEYSIKNTEMETTIKEEEECDGFSSSISLTSINTKLEISVTTTQTKEDPIVPHKPIIKARTSSLPVNNPHLYSLSTTINNNNSIQLSDPKTENIIRSKLYNEIPGNESTDEMEHFENNDFNHDDDEKDDSVNLFEKKDIKKGMHQQKKSLLSSTLYNHVTAFSTSSEENKHNENDSVDKTSLVMSFDGKAPANTENYSVILSELPDLYAQSISSSISSMPVSDNYKNETMIIDTQEHTHEDNLSCSLSSFSQSDILEEFENEYSFTSNNIKVYHHHQRSKHFVQNNDNNNEEFYSTELLKYTENSIDLKYLGETFDKDKIENVSHYHSVLAKFLLELLKNKCSEYFFLFHDIIQFQYKVFNTCDQFTREGQEIFNTYLTNSSNLKIDIDTKLIHKIAYGIKYYNQSCFIPLINIVLKFLENKYLNYKVHQPQQLFDTEDPNHKQLIMKEYCKVLDEHYSSDINSVKILTGQESPNQIYKNMLIRKKVLDFCILIFGQEYFTNKKSEGYKFKSKIVNFSEKLINPSIKI